MEVPYRNDVTVFWCLSLKHDRSPAPSARPYPLFLTPGTQSRQERKGGRKGLLYPGLLLYFKIHPVHYNLANNNLSYLLPLAFFAPLRD